MSYDRFPRDRYTYKYTHIHTHGIPTLRARPKPYASTYIRIYICIKQIHQSNVYCIGWTRASALHRTRYYTSEEWAFKYYYTNHLCVYIHTRDVRTQKQGGARVALRYCVRVVSSLSRFVRIRSYPPATGIVTMDSIHNKCSYVCII